MKHSRWTAGAIAAGVVMTTTGVALRAQPNRDDAPKMDHARRDDGGPGFRAMTPEQRQEERASHLREMLTDAGFTNQTMQDAIVAFANEQQEAHRALQDKARQINDALRDDANNAQLATLLSAYRAAEKNRANATRKSFESARCENQIQRPAQTRRAVDDERHHRRRRSAAARRNGWTRRPGRTRRIWRWSRWSRRTRRRRTRRRRTRRRRTRRC